MTIKFRAATATVAFGFAVNDPADGSASDADSTPSAFVREAGATASDAPITTGVSVQLLSNAGFPAGLYEVIVNGTTASLSADTEYEVYVSVVVGTVTSVGKVGTLITTALMDAAGIRTALGLASANLDTQLENVPTVAEFEARTIEAANYALEVTVDATNDALAEAISGVTPFKVDVQSISGDSDAADNLESYCDGTTPMPVNITKVNGEDTGVIVGAVEAGTLSTTQATTNLTGYTANQLVGRRLVVLSGDAEGEQVEILANAVSGGLLTFDGLEVAMAATDKFKIV